MTSTSWTAATAATASTASTASTAGWYPDDMPGQLRWWDGSAWSAHTTPRPAPVPAPLMAGSGPATHDPYLVRGAVPTVTAPAGSSPSDLLHWVLPTGRSGWSIASGYVALFALVLWPLGLLALGLLALGLGVMGLRHSRRTGTHGRGRAWFGILVGALATLGCVWALPTLLAG